MITVECPDVIPSAHCVPLPFRPPRRTDSRLNAETKQEIFRLEPNPRLLLSILCFFAADLPNSRK